MGPSLFVRVRPLDNDDVQFVFVADDAPSVSSPETFPLQDLAIATVAAKSHQRMARRLGIVTRSPSHVDAGPQQTY